MNQPDARTRTLGYRASSVLLVATVLVVWEVLGQSSLLLRQVFSSPSRIAGAAAPLVASGAVWLDVWASSMELVIGYALGALPALLIGRFMGQNPGMRTLLTPVVLGLALLPAPVLLAPSILLFGISDVQKWVVIAWATFLPVFWCTKMGTTLGSTGPLAAGPASDPTRLPSAAGRILTGAWIFTGLKLGLACAILTVVVTESYAATKGLGYLVTVAGATRQPDRLWVGAAALAVLNYFGWWLLTLVERLWAVRHYQPPATTFSAQEPST